MGGEVMIVQIRWEPREKPKRFVSPSEISPAGVAYGRGVWLLIFSVCKI
jgi:hypothetical protein